ncbi:MAG: hypothetical protein IPM63_11615 [Acidobacteriota bacterium]|nr:MAG: hypothetical protein IPM63_11615 [Acidobacteriota bacterium]
MGDYSERLFDELDVRGLRESIKTEATKKIQELSPDYVLSVTEDEVIEWLLDRFLIEVPVILEDEICIVEHGEAQVDARTEAFRYAVDSNTPFYVTGSITVVAIPFSGDQVAFKMSPSTWSSGGKPHGELLENEIRISLKQIEANAEAVKARYKSVVDDIKKHLEWVRNDLTGFKEDLRNHAKSVFNQRKQRLIANADMVSALGLPLRRREDAPKTYTTPVKRKKPRISQPPAPGKAADPPEPSLDTKEYDTILEIIEQMVLVMEKSPRSFESMDEEALRTHFLVQLNGQYEGQATGETFNYQGKTDILISINGRNIFIAECKIWKGGKAYLDTIDQILGYLTWRDTKTAILIFNRNKNFTRVLHSISETTPEHPNFIRELDEKEESSFRYIFHNNDDEAREIYLTVKAFDIPASIS